MQTAAGRSGFAPIGLDPAIDQLDRAVDHVQTLAFLRPYGLHQTVCPLDIARALNRPVALADWMGDVVDALAGRNKLVFNPDADLLAVPVVREGGWAVEKYL